MRQNYFIAKIYALIKVARKKHLVKRSKGIVEVIFLLIFQTSAWCTSNLEFDQSIRDQFVNKHRPIIVMGTDDGYVKPTAASIISIMGSTLENKSIIVLYNELSAANAALLEGLSDQNTKIATRKIDEAIRKQAAEFPTHWNILVQERIFYPEIFEAINNDKAFLEKVGLENPIEYFIHLDSDTLVLRDLSSILEYFSRTNDECFAAVNLESISPERLKSIDEANGVPPPLYASGGVVVWDLAGLKKQGINLVSIAKRFKAYRTLYQNEEIDLLNSVVLHSNVKQRLNIAEKIRHIIKEPNYLDTIDKNQLFASDHDVRLFFKSLSELKKLLSETEKLGAITFEEFCNYLYELVTADYPENRLIKEYMPTEEDVITYYPINFLPEKFNFIMGEIFTKIGGPNGNGEELLRKHLLKIPTIENELINNFNDMVVMHFDSCKKPWSNEFKELAQTNPELNKIIDVYHLFEGGIDNPSSAQERSQKALAILKTINPATELQKIKNGDNLCAFDEVCQ